MQPTNRQSLRQYRKDIDAGRAESLEDFTNSDDPTYLHRLLWSEWGLLSKETSYSTTFPSQQERCQEEIPSGLSLFSEAWKNLCYIRTLNVRLSYTALGLVAGN